MNGASTEVWANTSSTPTRSSMIMIGASHHFFRTRRNAQNSRNRLVLLIGATSSEETLHVTAAARSLPARDPEAGLRRRPHERVPPGQAPQQPDRRDNA